jgi:predicted GNAT family N-acyltransferase
MKQMPKKKPKMMIEVRLIELPEDLQKAFAIRNAVFVLEQGVSAAEEFESEEVCRHFLAFSDNIPCGTARWRFTEQGVKLQRFAVLRDFRSLKVGSALVKTLLEDIDNQPATKDKIKYLHAQVSAMGLYAKFGFKPVGEMFSECKIDHYKMVL